MHCLRGLCKELEKYVISLVEDLRVKSQSRLSRQHSLLPLHLLRKYSTPQLVVVVERS